ncbi:ABC transporter substrate-binding protein [Aeromicrobium sp.]|uniref:ABC transporter substrate-binding protein n=1 Tax=Aeromicrobium sp. TaxID=1871063 RepID=UPI0028A837C1|nr:ABC transporter substrate-binding protein [Aeromicrobium sp.]
MRLSRLVRTVALVATVSWGVTACGGGSAADSADSDGQTRTITDTFLGDVEDVPVDPERVVVLWRTGAEVVDLGITPVGQLDGELLAEELEPEVFEKVKDVPTVGSFEGVDVEKVIALEPDLILGMDHGGLEIDYEPLQEVAPTVIFTIAEPTDVWANYPKVADALGLTTDFDERNSALDADLAKLAQDHADTIKGLGQVTSVGSEYDGSVIYVDTSKSLTYDRMTKAGLTYNPTYTKDPERYVEELTRENIASLANQSALFYDVNYDGSVMSGVDTILDEPSFKRLSAAKEGRVFPLTAGTIYTFAAAQKQASDLRAALDTIAQG